MYDVLCTNKDKINLGIHKFTRKLWSLEMVICWHRAKIEIFLETLEKLLWTSQVLSHIF